jgi:hypothetical protein
MTQVAATTDEQAWTGWTCAPAAHGPGHAGRGVGPCAEGV